MFFGVGDVASNSYLWSTGDTSCCIIPAKSGTYVLTISNSCITYTDSVDMEIVSCQDCLYLPDIFSPNGDGRNDQFSYIVRCPVKSFEISIYSRWGERVFWTNDIGNKWDGSFKGVRMPIGTYFYYLQFATHTKPLRMMKGDVTIVR